MAVRLGIVIIHYNTPEDLGRCLASLGEHPPSCAHEVVVVDNASTEPGLDELQARFPEVRWLRNADNRGYARGCNQGLATVAADYHLVLNPDIVVLPGALDALLDFADQRPRAGIVGPQLLNLNGTVQESCRRFYTLRTLLLRRTFLGKLFPGSRTVSLHLMHDFDHASERAVDWVLGGCMLVRREALDRCGAMDERFFLYFEDVDWCYRMWQCGFEVVYCPDARFVHRHRRASAKGIRSRSFWLHLGSLISFYEKWSLVVYAVKKWRRPVEVLLHWLLDMVLLAVALLGAYGLRRLLQPLFAEPLLPLSWYGGWLASAAVLVTVAFAVMGRYGDRRRSGRRRAATHLKELAMVALLLLAGSFLGGDDVVSRAVLVMLLSIYTGLTAWGTSLADRLHRRLESGYLSLERTLLAGPRDVLAEWVAAAGDLRAHGVDVVGYVTADPVTGGGHAALGDGDVPWLGASAELPMLVERFRVSQVAFWPEGAGAPDPALLAPLRRARIRLRWILDDAWLLGVGARAERFGRAASGVLDPDDGLALRRWALRPLEILVALPLLTVSLLLAPWRGRRLGQGAWRREMVDGMAGRDHNGAGVLRGADGAPVALWWQDDLLRALLGGRIGIEGQRFAGGGDDGDTAVALRDAAGRRYGLTGPWAAADGRGGLRQRLAALFRNPGGLIDPAGNGRVQASRDGGEEVEIP